MFSPIPQIHFTADRCTAILPSHLVYRENADGPRETLIELPHLENFSWHVDCPAILRYSESTRNRIALLLSIKAANGLQYTEFTSPAVPLERRCRFFLLDVLVRDPDSDYGGPASLHPAFYLSDLLGAAKCGALSGLCSMVALTPTGVELQTFCWW